MRWYWWVIGLVVIAFAIWWYWTDIRVEHQAARQVSDDISTSSTSPSANVEWAFLGSSWKAMGKAPDCPTPLVLESPVDLTKATAILYPGQERGGDYKAHGGFRFADGTNADVTVTVPLDAQLVEASRYIEGGETQYMFEFVHPCGIAYRFDHLLTLSPTFQAVVETLPPAKVDDSRTTRLDPTPVTVGESIATAVGVAVTGNTFVDFGVYDRRSKNVASRDPQWATSHNPQLAHYGVCWFDLLSLTDEARVRSLPPADGASGTTSDYCQ